MAKKIERRFKYNSETLKDPDITLTPQEVAKYYSMTYPELTSGSVNYLGLVTDKDEEYMNYELSASIGVKG
jgi:PRTRC genetic system protein C